jgi:polyisoprenoid-binding protein YceI
MTMRTLSSLAVLLLLLPLSAQVKLDVDQDRSTIGWHGSKVTGAHQGNIRVGGGSITVQDDRLLAADVVVDMTSITCTDITNEGSNKRLVDHLRSEDFFAVEEHPEAFFRSASIEPLSGSEATDANYKVNGILEIKGIRHPVSFDCFFTAEGQGYRALGTLVFDRTSYEIQYRSGSFFQELGDKMIHDEVRLDLDIRTR